MIIIAAFAYLVVMLLISKVLLDIGYRSIMVALAMFCVLSVFQVINSNTEFIAEKLSSFVSWDMYTTDRFVLTFYVQYLLTYPMMAVFDHQYAAHSLNIALTSVTFSIVFRYIFKEKYSIWVLFLFLYPAFYHYAIFGLRDPIIAFVCVLFVIIYMRLSIRLVYFGTVLLAVMCIGIRPEFSVILLSFLVLIEFQKSNIKRKFLIGIIAFLGLYISLLIIPFTLGVQGTFSVGRNIEIISAFNESRALRHIGAEVGGGSSILGGNLYYYPLVVRYPIQVLASFVAPLPFEIRNTYDILAFIESIFFTGVAILAWFRTRSFPGLRLLVLCGIAYVMVLALFATNYGNVIRIRYPAYVFFLAGLYLPLWRVRKLRTRQLR